jgi:hypothetical protein
MIDHGRFLIVDFEGVQSISDAAARELFIRLPLYWGMRVEAINAEPRVAQTIRHVVGTDY